MTPVEVQMVKHAIIGWASMSFVVGLSVGFLYGFYRGGKYGIGRLRRGGSR